VKPTRAAWTALALVGLANMMSLLDRNILAILAPRIKADLKIGDAEMGLLYGTVFALFYALFSLPLGRLADGWARNKLLGGAIAFWSAATGLAAFANGFALLAISRLGVGIGEGATQPAGMSLLCDHFPRERRGLVMAVLAAAIAAGLGGSLALGGFAADFWDANFAGSAFRGWQFAFLVAAVPGLLLAVGLWTMQEPVRGAMDGIATKPDPAPFAASGALLAAITPGANWVALARATATSREWTINLVGGIAIVAAMVAVTTWASAFSPRPPLRLGGMTINPHALQWGVIGFGPFVILNWLQRLYRADRVAFGVIARSPSVVMIVLIGSLQTAINYGVMGFTPSFLMKSYALSPTTTGFQFGLLAAGLGIIGPMVSGPLSDVIGARWGSGGRIAVTLASLALSPPIAFWVYTAPDVASFYVRFVVYSLILTMWLPPLYAVMYDQVLPRMRGMISGLYIISSTILGLGTGPYFVGLVSDANAGDLGIAILSINAVAPVVIVLLILVALRVRGDESRLLVNARAAGEEV